MTYALRPRTPSERSSFVSLARRALAPRSTALSTAALVLLGAGCVRRQQAPDDRMLRAVEQEASSGVVAIATTMADAPSHITLCSGALVAPNLVLTARHCVSEAVTSTPSCDAYGRSHNGQHVGEDTDPARISVYVGERIDLGHDVPRAHATRTLHPTGRVLCDADVAYVVLDRSIDDVPVLAVGLREELQAGDEVVPIGFGGGPARAAGRRHANGPTSVLSVGPARNVATQAAVSHREF